MELATGQWRREWAGTAEYGKVIEEGVTRHVARAMEVLHASSAGARVRVMRAAYHSSSGPGNPSASFLMHSSRRVISSGSSLLDSPTFMTKPLEISSIPLESSPERYLDNNEYKVTEPDDTEISEPSKWRSSSGRQTTKLASEESSSADNSSVIDLDLPMSISRHTNALRKFSLDSDLESEVSFSKKPVDRLSPLLDVPTTLSTLKYKSLLNGTNTSWNDRRKSYSFENTSPPNEGALGNNESKAIDSSTDSGICKSTDLLNEGAPEKASEMVTSQDGSFRDWLAKNRLRPVSRDFKQEVNNSTGEGKIALLSKGNVSISIPANNNPNDSYQYKSYNSHEEMSRKSKRVGFSKTELHFAAETGTVNIVATDNKPPPSKDYRKRRSAFVPIRNHFEKPITLFGDKKYNTDEEFNFNDYDDDLNEFDENLSKKSILKNKIPKPKPYHLGTNTVIGQLEENKPVSRVLKEYIIPITQDTRSITPDNQGEAKGHQNDVKMIAHRIEQENSLQNTFWDRQRKQKDVSSNNDHDENSQRENKVRQTLNKFQGSPILPNKTRVRPLRESDLAYFGVSDSRKPIRNNHHKNSFSSICSDTDDEFKSVKLIQQISNSVQNSESEYEESPRYQNIQFGKIITPVPKPRHQVTSKAHVTTSNFEEKDQGTRRSKLRRENSDKIANNRSISEPPKQRLISHRAQHFTDSSVATKINNRSTQKDFKVDDNGAIMIRSKKKDNSPVYANLNYEDNDNNIPIPSKRTTLEKREAKESSTNNLKSTTQNATPELQSKTTNIEAQESKQIMNDKKTLSMSHKNQRRSEHKTEKTERSRHETETNRSVSKDRHEVKNSGKNKSKIYSDPILHPPVSNNRADITVKMPKVDITLEKLNNKIETPETLAKKKSHYEHTRNSSPRRKIKEIVINYDDKNGTASLTPREKQTAEKKNSTAKQKCSKLIKESSKHDNRKTNTSEKRYLLDNEEGEDKWLRSGIIHASRKPKSRNAVQRTCEIL